LSRANLIPAAATRGTKLKRGARSENPFPILEGCKIIRVCLETCSGAKVVCYTDKEAVNALQRKIVYNTSARVFYDRAAIAYIDRKSFDPDPHSRWHVNNYIFIALSASNTTCSEHRKFENLHEGVINKQSLRPGTNNPPKLADATGA